MTRLLALALVAIIEGVILFFVWVSICVWAGALEFPGFDEMSRFVRVLPGTPGEVLLVYGMPVGVSLATVAFLAPLVPRVRLRRRATPIWPSVFAAAFIGGALAFGLFFSLFECAILAGVAARPGGWSSEWSLVGALCGLLAIGWAIWTAILWRYGRRADHSAASKLLRIVAGGTAVELAITIPAYVWARGRDECYCALFSFWGLACGIGALFFLAGPGAFLIWHRRAGLWYVRDRAARCQRCGYLRAAGLGDRCPECGEFFGERRATDGI